MPEPLLEDGSVEFLEVVASDNVLLRSNIPNYSFVGFACAPGADTSVALTMGLVTNPPFPESRPIRILLSPGACRELAAALDRVTRVPGMRAPELAERPLSHSPRVRESTAAVQPAPLARTRRKVNSLLTRIGVASRSSATPSGCVPVGSFR
jgi:hypothetical protein